MSIDRNTKLSELTVGQIVDYLMVERPAFMNKSGASVVPSSDQIYDHCEQCDKPKKANKYRLCWTCSQANMDQCPQCDKKKKKEYELCWDCSRKEWANNTAETRQESNPAVQDAIREESLADLDAANQAELWGNVADDPADDLPF